MGKYCWHLSDERNCYEHVTNPQYTQVTCSGGRSDRDFMLIPRKKIKHVDSTNGLTILTIKVASKFQMAEAAFRGVL